MLSFEARAYTRTHIKLHFQRLPHHRDGTETRWRTDFSPEVIKFELFFCALLDLHHKHTTATTTAIMMRPPKLMCPMIVWSSDPKLNWWTFRNFLLLYFTLLIVSVCVLCFFLPFGSMLSLLHSPAHRIASHLISIIIIRNSYVSLWDAIYENWSENHMQTTTELIDRERDRRNEIRKKKIHRIDSNQYHSDWLLPVMVYRIYVDVERVHDTGRCMVAWWEPAIESSE